MNHKRIIFAVFILSQACSDLWAMEKQQVVEQSGKNTNNNNVMAHCFSKSKLLLDDTHQSLIQLQSGKSTSFYKNFRLGFGAFSAGCGLLTALGAYKACTSSSLLSMRTIIGTGIGFSLAVFLGYGAKKANDKYCVRMKSELNMMDKIANIQPYLHLLEDQKLVLRSDANKLVLAQVIEQTRILRNDNFFTSKKMVHREKSGDNPIDQVLQCDQQFIGTGKVFENDGDYQSALTNPNGLSCYNAFTNSEPSDTLTIELLPTIDLQKKPLEDQYFMRLNDTEIPIKYEFLKQCEACNAEHDFYLKDSVYNALNVVSTPQKRVWNITKLIDTIMKESDVPLFPKLNTIARKNKIENLIQELQAGKIPFNDEEKLYAAVKIAQILQNNTLKSQCGASLMNLLTPNLSLIRAFDCRSNWIKDIALIEHGPQFLACGGYGSPLQLFDINKDAHDPWELNAFTKNDGVDIVKHIVPIPDSQKFLSSSYDKTIMLWDIDKDTPERTFEGHKEMIRRIVPIPGSQWFLSCSYDKTIKLWNINKNTPERTFEGHTNLLRHIELIPDSQLFLSCSDDKTIKLWDIDKDTSECTYKGHTDRVNQIVMIPNNQWFLSCSDDKTIKLWDIYKKAPVRTFKGHTDKVRQIMMIPDSQWFLSCSNDKTIKLWNINNETCVRTFKGHTDKVRQIMMIPGSQKFLSCSYDKTIKLWNINNEISECTFNGHKEEVRRIVLIPNSHKFLSCSYDGFVKLWDYARFNELSFEQLVYCYKIFRCTQPKKLSRSTGEYDEFLQLPPCICNEAIKQKKVILPTFKAKKDPLQRPFKKTQ
jgi:WD40 repeat protein